MTGPHYGFNFQWLANSLRGAPPTGPDERALDFLVATGFDFVRLPTDYRFWTQDYDYTHPDERVLGRMDEALEACTARGLHLSLNLHRAPGYCINRNDIERDNLWLDPIAQEGFVFLWEHFARRFRGIPARTLSFDLINEPPQPGQYGMSRDVHEALMRRVVAAIRAIDPERPLIVDGLGGGHLAMPELADLGVTHSGRGYQPMPVSHHQATWWPQHAEAPTPVYPGVRWEGRVWDREALMDFYGPWREVESKGAAIHIGECGCHNKTPNDVALRWLADLFGVLHDLGWGYALWEFRGTFGIVEHGRPGARYEKLHGYNVDRELLDLLVSSRRSP